MSMKLSAILAPLVAANVSAKVILDTVVAYEQQQADALEHRRKVDAERQARKRERDKSRDVTLRHSDRSLVRDRVARVEDKPLTTVIEPQDKNSTPASPSPRQVLETVLDAEHASAVLDHRKRIKAALGERAAKLLAKELAKCPDPNAAADMMILRGWRGFEASWITAAGQQARAGPAAKASPMDHFMNFASEINGQDRDSGGGGSDWDDASGIPVRAIQHHG